MKLTSAFAAVFFGASLGLTVAQWVPEAPGVRVAPRGPSLHIGIEGAPAMAAVGGFGAGVLNLPGITLRKLTPKPPPPVLVPCDPTPQFRPGGYLQRVCR